VGSGTGVVQIMACHDLVLNTFVVELNRVLCIIAPEYKQVFDYKLLILAPPNFKSMIFFANFGL
jgi:hypothetical protein